MIPGNGVFPPNIPYETVASIRLERREPARNRLRFYTIIVTRTLFDGWAVIREWGRIGQPGTVRETWFETETAAIEAGEKVRQRKEKRGYRAVSRFNPRTRAS